MKTRRSRSKLIALALVVGSALGGLAGEAWAIVGRPLTPMSYAGVARRTTRRTAAVVATVPPPVTVRYW